MGDFISVIIVNWNGLKWLKPCLDSLYNQTYKNFEIIFVDNASTDKSVELIEKNYPQAIIIKNKENLGFAEANNMGLKNARGKFIFLLNNDTVLEKNCLEILLKTIKKIPNAGILQPKILLMNQSDKIDNCGLCLTNVFQINLRGFGSDQALTKYNRAQPIFSSSGAALFFKKEVADKIGLFDKDFGTYFEDIDFCQRAWLAGYECWYCPETKVYHVHCGTASVLGQHQIYYLIKKNMILTFVKNFELKTLVKFAIINSLSMPAAFFWFLLLGKFKHLNSLYKAITWNIKNINQTLEKRRGVQLFRKKDDREIFNMIK